MIFFIIGFIGCLIFLYRDFGYIGFGEVALSFLLGLAIGLLGMVVSSVILENRIPQTTETVSTQEIYSLKDNNGIKGGYYLFGGSIDDEYQYRYVISTPKGKQVETISSNDYEVYIKEGNYKPKIVKEVTKPKDDKLNWWLVFPLDKYQYTIYVPEGTIANEYNMDLE